MRHGLSEVNTVVEKCAKNQAMKLIQRNAQESLKLQLKLELIEVNHQLCTRKKVISILKQRVFDKIRLRILTRKALQTRD